MREKQDVFPLALGWAATRGGSRTHAPFREHAPANAWFVLIAGQVRSGKGSGGDFFLFVKKPRQWQLWAGTCQKFFGALRVSRSVLRFGSVYESLNLRLWVFFFRALSLIDLGPL